MNNFAAPPKTYRIQNSPVRADRSHSTELVLFAMFCGMTLVLAAVTAVLAISQVG